MAKILAIDYGLKRIGLAIGNEELKIAVPYKTLIKTDNQSLFTTLKEIIALEKIDKIVIGIPYYLNGEPSLTTKQVLNFTKKLKKEVNLPILQIDERYTSFEAEKKLSALNLKNKKKKKLLIDQLAASVILEQYFLQNTKSNI
ncbi:MAG: Holliday junction resolvase RuvX [Desulfonauticus sp.]|nr:Holliday junction resolvase RuvX [Desulfonauticus sp.]